MVLAFFLFLAQPLLSLIWSDVEQYSEIISTITFVVWFYWDAKKGNQEVMGN
tara:strand:- start:616 stop:771 length:156 start_codon:yes stop_codon:yes gene_type:complete